MSSITGQIVTMLDIDANHTDRANAAQSILTQLYGGEPVPAIWQGTRDQLVEVARNVRAMRPTMLDESVPGGTLDSDEPPTDKEPSHE